LRDKCLSLFAELVLTLRCFSNVERDTGTGG
jgi:hypothetical protein